MRGWWSTLGLAVRCPDALELILSRDGNEYWFERLAEPAHFEPPLADMAYVCLLWDYTGAANDTERRILARALVASNCRYAVCAGSECERWHDAIDRAAQEADRFLMTTWHDDEDEDNVAHFFVWNTFHPDLEFNRFLVLILGGNAPQKDGLVEAVHRHAHRATSA